MGYVELVKKLRYESTWRDDYPEDKDMLLQAADAVEELTAYEQIMETVIPADPADKEGEG